MTATTKKTAPTKLPPGFELPLHCGGSTFKPLEWSDLAKRGAPTIGWGISERVASRGRYIPRGWDGLFAPFADKTAAQELCDQLNTLAKNALQKSLP